MELSYTVTKREYIRAVKDRPEYSRNAKLVRIGLAFTLLGTLSGLMLWYFSNYVQMDSESKTLLMMPFFYLAISLLLIWQLPYFKVPRMVSRKLRHGELPTGFFGAHSSVLTEDALSLNQGDTVKRLPCRGLRCEGAAGGTLICAGSTVVEFIPNSAFASQEERDGFVWAVVEAGRAEEAPAQAEAQAAYSVSFTWEREPFVEAAVEGNWMLISNREFWTVGRIALTVLTGTFGALSLFRAFTMPFFSDGDVGSISFGLLIGILVILLPNIRLIAGLPFFCRRTTRSQIKNGVVSPENFMQQSFLFGESGISSHTATGHKSYLWPQITRCAYRKGALIIIIEDKWIQPIPGDAFRDDAQREEIMDYIAQRMGQ